MGSVEVKSDWTALGMDMRRHVLERCNDETVTFGLRKDNGCRLEQDFVSFD